MNVSCLHILVSTSFAVVFTSWSGSFVRFRNYFFMASLISSFLYFSEMSLRALMETSRMLGTGDDVTFKMSFMHLSTYF